MNEFFEENKKVIKVVFHLSEFCENCVAVSPNDVKIVKNKVVFSTGCKSTKCIADLNLKSSLDGIIRLVINA